MTKDHLKRLVDAPLEDWSKKDLKALIKIVEIEIREWERLKAEAYKYL